MQRAGLRIKAVRQLIGLSQQQFGDLLTISRTRVINVENDKAKANEEDYYRICSLFPEFSEWLTHGGIIELARLKVGKTGEHAHALALIESGQVPQLLKHKIR